MSKINLSDPAIREGIEAYNDGRPVEDNPFPRTSGDWYLFRDGWNWAFFEDDTRDLEYGE